MSGELEGFAFGLAHSNAAAADSWKNASLQWRAEAERLDMAWEGLLSEEGAMMDFLEMIMNNVARKPGAGFAMLDGTPLDFKLIHSVEDFKRVFYAKRKKWATEAVGRATGDSRELRQKTADNPYFNAPPGHEDRLNRIAKVYMNARTIALNYNANNGFASGMKSAC
jgi:hypothetical protein